MCSVSVTKWTETRIVRNSVNINERRDIETIRFLIFLLTGRCPLNIYSIFLLRGPKVLENSGNAKDRLMIIGQHFLSKRNTRVFYANLMHSWAKFFQSPNLMSVKVRDLVQMLFSLKGLPPLSKRHLSLSRKLCNQGTIEIWTTKVKGLISSTTHRANEQTKVSREWWTALNIKYFVPSHFSSPMFSRINILSCAGSSCDGKGLIMVLTHDSNRFLVGFDVFNVYAKKSRR